MTTYLKSSSLLIVIMAVSLVGCGDKAIKPAPSPEITVVVPVVCNEQKLPDVKLDPVEFTLVDGVDVLTGKQGRWAALTLDGWSTLIANQNRVLERTQSLVAVLDYYQSCIKAAQAVKPEIKK